MALSPAKKQKVDDAKSPIVFHTPGLKPDVRLMVFDEEFHVHSVLLKLHSAFFRKFLDSPDKYPPTGATVITSTDVAASSTLASISAPAISSSRSFIGLPATFKYE